MRPSFYSGVTLTVVAAAVLAAFAGAFPPSESG
jgi:hypothetical protein